MIKIMLAAVLASLLVAGCTAKVETKGEGGISDSDVTSNVEKVLASTKGVDPSQIDVKTKDGDVTLDGQVASNDAKDKVGEIVSVVKGVDKVENNLKVTPSATPGQGTGNQPTQQPSGQQPSGQQPAVRREPGQQQQTEQQVRSALKNSNALSGVNMNVQTQNGKVTLSGTVPNQASKELAERIARQQQGVTSVQNDLQVKKQQ